jgi:hypothetical protein
MEAAAEPRKTTQSVELRAEVQHRHACCMLHVGRHGTAPGGVLDRDAHLSDAMGRSRAAFVVIGTSLTVEACHSTNIVQLGARKAARVNAELRASRIGRFDGMELAHDDPDAPGIITGRPVVGEIWSIGGAGAESRHRRRAPPARGSIRENQTSTRMSTKLAGCNRKLQRLHD